MKKIYFTEEERKEATKKIVKKAGEKWRRSKGMPIRKIFNNDEERKLDKKAYLAEDNLVKSSTK